MLLYEIFILHSTVLYFNHNYICGRRPLAINNTLSTTSWCVPCPRQWRHSALQQCSSLRRLLYSTVIVWGRLREFHTCKIRYRSHNVGGLSGVFRISEGGNPPLHSLPFPSLLPIIFLPCGFFLSSIYLSFFPRLISAATDWMSTILLHMAWP